MEGSCEIAFGGNFILTATLAASVFSGHKNYGLLQKIKCSMVPTVGDQSTLFLAVARFPAFDLPIRLRSWLFVCATCTSVILHLFESHLNAIDFAGGVG